MSPALVMILTIRRQHTAQVTLIEDDDVIETFAADRADDQRRAGIPGECAPTFPKPVTLCMSDVMPLGTFLEL
jgi:hypothetical protein